MPFPPGTFLSSQSWVRHQELSLSIFFGYIRFLAIGNKTINALEFETNSQLARYLDNECLQLFFADFPAGVFYYSDNLDALFKLLSAFMSKQLNFSVTDEQLFSVLEDDLAHWRPAKTITSIEFEMPSRFASFPSVSAEGLVLTALTLFWVPVINVDDVVEASSSVVVAFTPHSDDCNYFLLERKLSVKQFLKRRRLTLM